MRRGATATTLEPLKALLEEAKGVALTAAMDMVTAAIAGEVFWRLGWC